MFIDKLKEILLRILKRTALVHLYVSVCLSEHRRKVAIGVSLGLHALVIACFLITAAPEITGGGTPLIRLAPEATFSVLLVNSDHKTSVFRAVPTIPGCWLLVNGEIPLISRLVTR